MAILSLMFSRLLALLTLITLVSACAPVPANTAPTVVAFPTMTPGRTVRGVLPPVAALPLDGSIRANPATAVALAIRPTATPDYSTCPPSAAPQLAPRPVDVRDMADEITRFLSSGGTPAALQDALRDDWEALGETGIVRADFDLTGEGTAEVLVTVNGPEDSGGALLILGCSAGRYIAQYQVINEAASPQLIYLGDVNQDTRPDVLYSGLQCELIDAEEAGSECVYQTQLLTWQPEEGRFTSLLNRAITSVEPPSVTDMDNDRVLEIVARLSSSGTPNTGPLRTGVQIYDWNGTGYLLSITQLDPPRFRIQVIHQADRNVQRRELNAAVDLYQLALNDGNLQNWFNNEQDIHNSYILYRLLTIYAFTEDERLLSMYQAIITNYTDLQAAPVYATMGIAFWDTFQTTNNLRSACQAVQDIITARPEALELVNRYGSRSPSYTATDLCPF